MSGKKSDLLKCPYDSSHRIMRSRMATHLIRCERNNPGCKNFCPFNSTHVINDNAHDLKKHLETCPDRSAFEDHYGSEKIRCPYATDENKTNVKDCPNRSASNRHVEIDQEVKGDVGFTENWDDEPDVPTYDPKANWNDKFLIKNPQGNSRATKRAFREKERERFEQNGKF